MRSTFLLSLVAAVSSFSSLFPGQQATKPGTLHALLVGATNDVEIGKMVAIDISCMDKSIRVIGRQLGFKVRMAKVVGKACNPTTLSDKLAKLRPSKDDIVMFYYSGHGYNPGGGEAWPRFCIKPNEPHGAKIRRYISRLPKKSAIILFDCCNEPRRRAKAASPVRSSQAGFSLTSSDNLTGFISLLRSFKGTVSIGAARVGKEAFAIRGMGGQFTRNFLQAIQELGPKSGITWRDVCKAAVKKSRQPEQWPGRPQTPFYHIVNKGPGPSPASSERCEPTGQPKAKGSAMLCGALRYARLSCAAVKSTGSC